MASPKFVVPAFRRVFGEDFARFLEEIAEKTTKSRIDTVGRQRKQDACERAQNQPNRPLPDPEDQWWNK